MFLGSHYIYRKKSHLCVSYQLYHQQNSIAISYIEQEASRPKIKQYWIQKWNSPHILSIDPLGISRKPSLVESKHKWFKTLITYTIGGRTDGWADARTDGRTVHNVMRLVLILTYGNFKNITASRPTYLCIICDLYWKHPENAMISLVSVVLLTNRKAGKPTAVIT